MSIPMSTSTGTVLRLPDDKLNDDSALVTDADYAAVATGIRAHIYPVSGRETVVGGEQEVIEFRLCCDPCDLRHTDRWRDESDGTVYLVLWSKLRQHPALDHIEAGLRTVQGVSP